MKINKDIIFNILGIGILIFLFYGVYLYGERQGYTRYNDAVKKEKNVINHVIILQSLLDKNTFHVQISSMDDTMRTEFISDKQSLLQLSDLIRAIVK